MRLSDSISTANLASSSAIILCGLFSLASLQMVSGLFVGFSLDGFEPL